MPNSDELNLLAQIAIDATALIGKTNTLELIAPNERNAAIHSAALSVNAMAQLALGEYAGLITEDDEIVNDLGRALWDNDATYRQINEALTLATARNRGGPFADCETIYLVEGGPITAEQVSEGIHAETAIGQTEWQVSDGPAGNRGYSEDFASFGDALARARQFPGARVLVDLIK